jgi:hypothetical protein
MNTSLTTFERFLSSALTGNSSLATTCRHLRHRKGWNAPRWGIAVWSGGHDRYRLPVDRNFQRRAHHDGSAAWREHVPPG